MKKLKNILLAVFALVLVMMPMAITGCGGPSLKQIQTDLSRYLTGMYRDLDGMAKYLDCKNQYCPLENGEYARIEYTYKDYTGGTSGCYIYSTNNQDPIVTNVYGQILETPYMTLSAEDLVEFKSKISSSFVVHGGYLANMATGEWQKVNDKGASYSNIRVYKDYADFVANRYWSFIYWSESESGDRVFYISNEWGVYYEDSAKSDYMFQRLVTNVEKSFSIDEDGYIYKYNNNQDPVWLVAVPYEKEVVIASGITTIDSMNNGIISSYVKPFSRCYYATTLIIDSAVIANEMTNTNIENWGISTSNIKTIYIKAGLTTANSAWLHDNYSVQANTDKDGYVKYVFNGNAN